MARNKPYTAGPENLRRNTFKRLRKAGDGADDLIAAMERAIQDFREHRAKRAIKRLGKPSGSSLP